MDYSTFYPQQQTYPNLTTANLQNLHTNNTPFQLNPSPPIAQSTADQCPNHQNNISPLQQNNISPLQQNSIQPLQAANLAQLQTNMFFMDPFDTKVDTSQANDLDHASYSNESDVFLDELDDISRTATAAQSRRSLNPATTRRNPSPHNPPNDQQPLRLQSADFDISDITGQDFMDTSFGGNSTKRKAQNRAAQRAFRERKERHVKELEAKVSELENVTKRMQEENEKLKYKLSTLESENNVLKGSNITFTFPQFEKATPVNGNYSPPLSDHSSLDLEKSIPPQDLSMFSMDEITPPTPQSVQPQQPRQQQLFQTQPTQQPPHHHSDGHSLNTPVAAKAQNLMMQYHDYTQHNSSAPAIAEDGHNYFDCPKVWERIVMHPRFEEVDIEALCAELNAKVKICVERGGPSVESQDLEKALDEAIDTVSRK